MERSLFGSSVKRLIVDVGNAAMHHSKESVKQDRCAFLTGRCLRTIETPGWRERMVRFGSGSYWFSWVFEFCEVEVLLLLFGLFGVLF